MNKPNVKIGIVAVSRDCFPIELSKERLGKLFDACKGLDVEVFAMDTVIENENDTLKAYSEYIIMNIVFNSLIPVFALMALGAVSKKFNILGENSEKVISRFVLYFSLPAILFIAIAQSPIKDLLKINFLIAMCMVMFIFYIGIFILCILLRKSIHVSSLRSLGISFPNTAFMGIPILLSIFGEKSLLPLAVVNLIATLMFCGTVFILEITDKKQEEKNIYKKVIKILLTQPILLAIIAGILASGLKIEISKPIANFCQQLGSTAGPCAMFILGEKILDLKISAILKRHISFGLFTKLILMPILAFYLLIALDVTPMWAASGLILMALPSAGTTYMLAVDKNVCITESSELIILTTVISLFTLTLIILIIPYAWPTVQFVV